jgi:hypothetical protein
MESTHTSNGRFAVGNPGGPGRPRRAIEREYLAALSDTVSLGDWREIVERASPSIVSEIDSKVDMVELERGLMEEGLKKFAEPQTALVKLIAEKRAAVSNAGIQ